MSELITVYDENGNLTDRIATRETVHREGLWHRVVHCWILETSTNRLLMQRRSPSKISHPNKWDCCAGHVIAGSTSAITAQREIYEEVGLKVNVGEPILTIRVQITFNTYIDRELVDIYLIKLETIDLNDLILQREEVSEVKLMDFETVKRSYETMDPDFINPGPEIVRDVFNSIKLNVL
jgi:isopentenyldiphosphate isomerase